MGIRQRWIFAACGVFFFASVLRAQDRPHTMDSMPGMQMPEEKKPGMPAEQGMKMGTGMGMATPSMSSPMQADPGMKVGDEGMKLPQAPKLRGPAVKLSELEQMALSRNPTIAQASASVRAAEGVKRQAGLYPNPTMGYYGDEIRGGSFRSGKQGGFLSQTIVMGGKLGAASRTAEQDRLLALTGIDSQRFRVLTAVRTQYWEALAAQRMVEARQDLLGLAQDAVQTSYQLGNVGQADRPDVLQSEVERDQAALDLEAAIQNQQYKWRSLSIVVGNPDMAMAPLEGSLEDVPQFDEQEWMKKIATDSPQMKMAQQEIERARLSLIAARKLPIPDIEVSGNLSQDNEPLEPTGRRVGIVGGAQIGVQLPIFNHNQGGVEGGKAEIARSEQEVDRVRLELQQRMNILFADYKLARSAAERYKASMLPRAQRAYDMYKFNYENMAAAYPQVLIAQRTLFQLRVDYIEALRSAWVSAAAIQGYGLSDGLSSSEATSGSTAISRATSLRR